MRRGRSGSVTKPIRVGIAGFGKIGQRRKDVMDDDENYQVVAVCDILHGEAPSKLRDGTLALRTYPELLEQDLDALIVCMPNDMASEVVVAALQRDLHVFCEKPPGRNVADIEAVRAAEALKPTLKLKYGFNHRYHDSVVKALSIVESGEMGRVVNMRGVYGKSAFIPWPRPTSTGSDKDQTNHWRTSRQIAGGGILLDQGIHMVDLMLAFAGEPFNDVKSFVSNSFWGHDVEDNAFALMRNNAGVVASIHSTATQWRHKFALEIFLEDGALVLSGILSGSKSYGDEKLTVIKRVDEANGMPQEITESFIFDNSWRREMDEFAHCVVNDQPVEIGTSLHALHSMQTVYRIYDADESWRENTGRS
jgi:predicted dehydrogenase